MAADTSFYARPQTGSRPPRELAPCGTPAAYRRHLRHGERPCSDCLAAERVGRGYAVTALVPDPRPVRNGIPVRLYVYRGSGADAYTGEVVTP